MNFNFIRRLPRSLYGGVIVAALIYGDHTDRRIGYVVIALVVGTVFLFKLCFPLFYQLDRSSRNENKDDD